MKFRAGRVNRTESDSVKYSPEIMEKVLGTDDVFPLWVADMDFPAPGPVIRAMAKRLRHGVFGYTTMLNSDRTFRAVSGWLKERQNWDIKAEWLVHSPGVVNALHHLVQGFCKPGQGVIVQNPVYGPFRSVVASAECRLEDNRLLREQKEGRLYYQIDFRDLEERACKEDTVMMILCSPHNPVGRVWTKEELLQVWDICRRNNVLLVSDEIHGDLIFPKEHFIPLGAVVPEREGWLSLTAPSKTFNIPGLSTSLAIIPGKKERNHFLHAQHRGHAGHENPLGLAAMEAAYSRCGGWVDGLNRYLKGNYDLLAEKLPEQFKLCRSEGTYLAWIDVSVLGSEKDILDYFYRERKLGIQPGSHFGPGGEGFVRLNFGLPRNKLKQCLEFMV